MVMTMSLAMEMTMGGQAIPKVKLPAMRTTIDLEVTDVTAEKDVRYSFKISNAEVVDDPGVMPEVSGAMRAQMQKIVGMTGKGVVTARGVTKESTIDVPPGLDPQTRQTMDSMKQGLNQLSAPFPEEEVGQGAKWEVDTVITQNGLTLKQTATYTLGELGRNGGKATVAIAQKADRQQMNAPGLPPGATIQLEEMTGSGEGEAQLDLTRLTPPSASMQSKGNMRATIEMGTQKQPMTMAMEMDLKVEGK
jgi:hypothetical protein